MRTPITLNRRECVGKYGHVEKSYCRKCEELRHCKSLSRKLDLPSLYRNNRKTHKAVQAEGMSPQDAWDICNNVREKYGFERRRWMTEPWEDSLGAVLSACAEEDVDPAVYIEAQYWALYRWCRERRLADLYPNMLKGPKALERHAKYTDLNLKRFRTIRDVDDGVDEQSLEPELLFAEQYVLPRALGEDVIRREIILDIQEDFPDWSPRTTPRALKNMALQRLLEQVLPGLAQCVSVESRWVWKDVVLFLRKSLRRT